MLTSPYPIPPSRLWAVVRAAAYLAIAASGLAVLASVPASYAGLSSALTLTWGVLCLLGGILMAYGVAARRYRWEWLPSWIAVMGVAMYGALSWHQVIIAGIGHAPRALLITALALLLLSRAIQLALIDMGARRIAQLRSTDEEHA